jgi:argininosuccinate lyase
LFDAVRTCRLALRAVSGLIATAEFSVDRMRAAADAAASAATDLAEHLVRGGMPFRDAHALVGGLVRQSLERGIPLEELVTTEPRLGPDALVLLQPGEAVRRRTSPGGAGPAPVARQLEEARSRLAEQRHWLGLEPGPW